MQDFDVFCLEGVFFFSVPLGILRQGISSSVSFALMIINSKVVTREFLGPAHLFGAKLFVSMNCPRLLWLVSTRASCQEPSR